MDQTEASYGKLLFEDDWNHGFARRMWTLLGGVLIFAGIILGIFLRFSSEYKEGSFLYIVVVIIPFFILGLCAFYLRSTYSKFRIYEKGIFFRAGFNSFLPFDHIDYILVIDHQRIIIHKKPPNEKHTLFIASEASKSSSRYFIGDWSRFMETLEIRLKQTHPGQDAAVLIRKIPDSQLEQGAE